MDRNAIAAALDRLGVPQAAMTLRRAAAPWITVLTYHRVASPSDAAALEEGVVDVTPSQLERQLVFVKRWFRPVGIKDILVHVREGKPLPPNPLLVTFDDGYRDNHDVALPILVRHGIRATFFISTDFVDRRRPFWWDCVAYILKRSPRERIVLEYPERVELSLRDAHDRDRAIQRALRIIKDVRLLDLERFLGELQRAADLALGADEQRQLAEATVMTWNEVAALRRAGMDVQSHTRTHRVLQTLDAATLADELRGSRRTLEDVLGEPIRAISYPVGQPLGAAPAVREAVRTAGYEVGFSNGTGVSAASGVDPLDVKRISLDVGLSDPFFRAMLALPWLAY
jgi:peptidoglycan/xylan/chitin deacetylase (PgdA/CDA1 family)